MLPHLEFGKEKPTLALQTGERKSALRKLTTDWSQFRGPERDGIAPAQGIELNWSASPLLRWKVPSGEGHSSIITFGQSVITMEQDGQEELVIARSLDDGQTLWKHSLKTRWDDFMSGVGPRSTPTLSDGKLYALYSDGSLVCLDAGSGKPLWETKTVGINHEFPEWGFPARH